MTLYVCVIIGSGLHWRKYISINYMYLSVCFYIQYFHIPVLEITCIKQSTALRDPVLIQQPPLKSTE